MGGKRKIVDQLIKFIPKKLNNYYEPFLGGGALFFHVRDKFKQCYLSDINLELVTSYNAVKTNPDAVSKLLDSHKAKHSKEHYYQVRANNDSSDPIKITAILSITKEDIIQIENAEDRWWINYDSGIPAEDITEYLLKVKRKKVNLNWLYY
ncbi:D12 class N6 adenine-specific DNA methyltransferase family protein [Rickettsia argasii T170-B]|uniref:site-specific DNA-methyltransferase (adenine-specific) n=1 Tax=Rickettsia argasii T170-B TaxID=1268837 RepID=A0A0F3RFH4_9RICK|nr:D12 class N6 adenine-specific DNA methyltransferase family protein [Rickettsia argasii T170-B]